MIVLKRQCDQNWRVTRQMAGFKDSRRAKILDGGWRVSGGQKFGRFLLSKIAKKAGFLKKNFALRMQKNLNFSFILGSIQKCKKLRMADLFLGWYVFTRAVTKRFQFFQINFKFIFLIFYTDYFKMFK